MPGSAFDEYSGSYEQALAQGIQVSGEDSSFFARGRLVWLASYIARHNLSTGSVLDYGCGTGNSLPMLRELLHASRVVGVDISAASIAMARQRFCEAQFELSTCDELPAASLFDWAFCNGVFHHIPVVQRQESARFVWHHLQPGGHFAFFENNPLNPGTRYVMSRIAFDHDAETLLPWAARGLLKSAGFKIVRTDFLFFFPRPLAWLRRLEPALSQLPLGAQYMVLAQKPFLD